MRMIVLVKPSVRVENSTCRRTVGNGYRETLTKIMPVSRKSRGATGSRPSARPRAVLAASGIRSLNLDSFSLRIIALLPELALSPAVETKRPVLTTPRYNLKFAARHRRRAQVAALPFQHRVLTAPPRWPQNQRRCPDRQVTTLLAAVRLRGAAVALAAAPTRSLQILRTAMLLLRDCREPEAVLLIWPAHAAVKCVMQTTSKRKPARRIAASHCRQRQWPSALTASASTSVVKSAGPPSRSQQSPLAAATCNLPWTVTKACWNLVYVFAVGFANG